MGLDNCIREAKEWVKENSDVKLNARELEQVGKLLSYAEDSGANPAEKAALMQQLVEQKLAHDQAVNRAVYLKNALLQEKSLQEVTGNGERWAAAGQSKGAAYSDAMLAKIEGGATRPGIGTNEDPMLVKKSALTQYLSFLHTVLKPEEMKLLQTLDKADPMSRDIYLELGGMRQGTALGQTNNDLALSIAKGIRKVQDYSLQDMKGVNPYFSENGDFLLSRTHDRELMKAMGKAEWLKLAMQKFSGSFAGMTPEEKTVAFGDIYDAKMSGSYTPSEAVSNDAWAPRGTAKNQGLAAAPRRVLVANSPMAEWEYSSKVGSNIWPTLMQGMEDRAQTVSTVSKWGLHAADNFQAIYQKTLSALAKSDPEASAAFERSYPDFKEAFEKTQVRRSNEAFTWQGRQAQNLLAVTRLALMGKHVPRSLSSYATAIATATDTFGKTLPENALDLGTKMAQAILPGGGGGREAAMALGVHIKGWAEDIMGDLSNGASEKPGLLAHGAELIGKLSGTDRFVSSGKSAMAQFTGSRIGALASDSFEKLSPQAQDELARYSLHGTNWEVLRQAVATDGRMKGMITPEAIRDLSDAQTAPLLRDNATPRDAMAARTQLALRYSTLLNDEASMTMSESNSRAQRAAYGTSTPDQTWGIARRFMMQFKIAALMEQQSVMRTFRSGGGDTSNLSGVISRVVMAGFLGMIGQAVINAGSGKEVASPLAGEMLGRGAMNAAGLGVLGDALFNALREPPGSRQQAVMASDLVGPAVGTAMKGISAAAKTLQGIGQAAQGEETNGQYGGKEWADMLHSILPGHNIFYISGALNYLILNQVQASMGKDGFMANLRKQTGKTDAWPEFLGGQGGKRQPGLGEQNFWEQ